ncbi:MAG: thioredoxin domain-containing protein [Patescibacteria group bacterium]
MKTPTIILAGLIVIVLIIAGAYFLVDIFSGPGEFDNFAQCLKDKGAVFYGAFWCPHCQNQKAMFGKSAKLLNYVECSTPDGNRQTQICQEKNITGYPTWEFADGSRESGEVSLQKLAEKTACLL